MKNVHLEFGEYCCQKGVADLRQNLWGCIFWTIAVDILVKIALVCFGWAEFGWSSLVWIGLVAQNV